MNQRPERPDRRYDQPAFPIKVVVSLARGHFVLVTAKAGNEAARYFGDEAVSLRNEIVDALTHLCLAEWKFAQVKDGTWADVYRVGIYDDWPDAWIKVSIEHRKGHETVVVFSFHEWD